jgi:hypothetical protein
MVRISKRHSRSLVIPHCMVVQRLLQRIRFDLLLANLYASDWLIATYYGKCILAQRGQNYEHVHIISITQISFSYVQISVSIQIRRSSEKNRQSRVQIRRSRFEIRRS